MAGEDDIPKMLSPEEIDRIRQEAAAEAQRRFSPSPVSSPVSSSAEPNQSFASPTKPAEGNDPFRLGLGGNGTEPVKLNTSAFPLQERVVRGAPPGGGETEPGTGTRVREPRPPTYAPAGGGGSPYTPAGMRPDKLAVKSKLGVPVPQEARDLMDQADVARLGTAGLEKDFRAQSYAQTRDLALANMKANDDARRDHERIQAERDQTVKSRLAQIEDLNRQAQVRPEDMWNDRVAFGRLIGMLSSVIGFGVSALTKSPIAAIGGGMSANLMNSFINQDIQSKLAARRAAGEQAGRQTDLLHLHLDRMKDEDKAVEATRLAYWDNILQQADLMKAQLGPKANEIAYRNLVADIGTQRAQTLNTLAKQEAGSTEVDFSQKWQNATGGAGAGVTRKEPGNIVVLGGGANGTDETAYSFPTPKAANAAYEKIESKQRLIRINNDIARLRKGTKDLDPVLDWTDYRRNIAKLEELEQNKLKAMETAEQQGVLRKEEYENAKMYTGFATRGLGLFKAGWNPVAGADYEVGNSVLEQQTSRWTEDLHQIPHAAGGHVVERGYQTDPDTGEPIPTARYTGQDVAPTPGLAPRGSRGMDSRASHPTMNASDTEATPPAKVFPYVPTSKAAKKHRAHRVDDEETED